VKKAWALVDDRLLEKEQNLKIILGRIGIVPEEKDDFEELLEDDLS
jgi:hypothetical protein